MIEKLIYIDSCPWAVNKCYWIYEIIVCLCMEIIIDSCIIYPFCLFFLSLIFLCLFVVVDQENMYRFVKAFGHLITFSIWKCINKSYEQLIRLMWIVWRHDMNNTFEWNKLDIWKLILIYFVFDGLINSINYEYHIVKINM